MIQTGDRVRIAELPRWVGDLPGESQRVFEFCLGRTYRVEEINVNGLCILDVSEDVDERFGGRMNDLGVEAESLEKVEEGQ